MESERAYPFKCVESAICYFRLNNPARQKFYDPLDPEPRSSEKAEDFTGKSSRDIWASVCAAIERVQKGATNTERETFRLYYLDDIEPYKLGVREIARRLSVSPQKIYRMLQNSRDELEAELVRRELIEPLPDDNNPPTKDT